MALFRKSRRQRASDPDAAQAPAPSSPRPASSSEALRERLREIAAGSQLPEDALEPALRAVLEASRAQAGAVCVFDSRHAILRLVTEVGLSDEGCRRLRSVRRGDPSAWDMPLQGLLNRRAYLIESASRNRYVPRLVEHANSVRTIACVPLYAGPTPVGSLVLITTGPRSLGERDIRTLERAVGELAAMIEAVRRRGGLAEETPEPAPKARPFADLQAILVERERLRGEVTARLAERAVLAAELTARTGEAERLRAALEAAQAERSRLAADLERAKREVERAGSVSASLAAAERERARLAAALETAAAERAERARAEQALEQARMDAERAAAKAADELAALRSEAITEDTQKTSQITELTAEIERLQGLLEQGESAVARERAFGRERDRERERLAEELHAAVEREQRLREDLHAAGERASTSGNEAVQHALETARQAEEARAATAAELAAVRNALSSAQEVVLALEDEAARSSAEIERLAASHRVTSSEHERLEIAIAEGRARELATVARLAELTREAEIQRQESGRLGATARSRDAEAATLTARVESLAAERDRLQEALAAAEEARDRFAADATSATAAQTHLGEALARESAERARLTAALGTAQAALGELEATLSRRESETAEQAAAIERLVAERDRAVAERVPSEPSAPAPVAPRSEPVRLVTVTAPASGRGRARELDAGRIVTVLDVTEAWCDALVPGRQVVVVAPGDDLTEQLGENVPERIVVNLLAPGALHALAALRAAGSTARFWGCIADPGADRALALGMVEPAERPLDPDAIVETLGRYAVRGTRVVTAGADVDGLMSLRQALARRGLSVSMAWDAKQAADLLHVVRPEVVIVDLGLPRRDGYGIVARLATVDPVPSAVVIPGAEDASTGFAATLADPAHSGRALTLGQFLAAILARSEAPPAERRQKVRAVGRK